MHKLVSVFLLLATVGGAQAAPAPRVLSHSTDILLRLHPLPWRAPVTPTTLAPGMRIEPDTGEATDPAAVGATAVAPRTSNPLAGVQISTRADGSRFAVLAGKLRSYSVVRVGADGQLQQECLHSEAAARKALERAPQSGGH